ncbi:MAG: ATP-dependent DNA helicase RecG [Ruminococcaceae bacterium]|nr:ATP-dependent DNA helicase RecG [Oscillospiraceae bacterium]
MSTDIRRLYGVGAVRAAAYARLGVYTVEELLEHYPRGYEERGNIRLLCESDGVGKSAHVLTVATEAKSVRIRGRMSMVKFRAYDESGICDITFFNQEYLKAVFVPGSEFRFYGRVEKKGNRYFMTAPAYEPIREGEVLPPLIPVYPLTEGITQKQLAKDMRAAMVLAASFEDGSNDPLPEELRHKYGLCLQSYALRNIHMPDSFSALAAAKKRLIFEEFFTYALGLSMASAKKTHAPAVPCLADGRAELEAMLPYALTGAQRRVIGEIVADLARDTAMNRLLVGDVGCGKTVCAAAAMLTAVRSGRQAALMAPTEILARQHYAELCGLFEPLGVRCALLIGATSAAEKKKIYRGLCAVEESERIAVVVGTQALLSEGVSFAAPGLVVTDEQHRFGVNQRAILAEKNALSHLLVMSATPIPRSLALSLYGDLDLSVIDEMPPGRQRVDTYVVDERYRERLDGFILKQVAEGGQVYVVCPAVEENSEEESFELSMEEIDGEGQVRRGTPLKSAVSYAEELKERFPALRIGVLHGRMKSKEKDAVMAEFSAGRMDVLVSTTVIEVGVNVPNACLMIVENADRFGLSQLHQLRGRVGRGRRKSFCVLVSESATGESDAQERLSVMKSCYDGYAIAERDLEMRGPGDFLRGSTDVSVRQSGGVRFRLAALCDDTGLMKTAFAEARAMIGTDPDLSGHPLLAERVRGMFALEEGTIN